MIDALWAGWKDVTRCPIEVPEGTASVKVWTSPDGSATRLISGEFIDLGRPKYLPGERVAVAESVRIWWDCESMSGCIVEYRDGTQRHDNTGTLLPHVQVHNRWRYSRSMPVAAARMHAEILSLRVERLQDITREEIGREGIDLSQGLPSDTPAVTETWPFEVFRRLWNDLHGKKPGERWEDNPFVGRYELQIERVP